MKHKLNFCLILFSLFLFSCNFPGIFDSNSENSNRDRNTSDSDILLSVDITGGIAGIHDKLTIDEFGIATFENLARSNKKWEVQLKEDELAELNTTMTSNNFFELDSQYFDSQVADAFYYDIFYTNNYKSNRVNTDNFASPDNLKNIIAKIHALIDSIRNTGLDFELKLSNNSMGIGDEVTFSFSFQNTSDNELTLEFSDGQIYDFYVYAANETSEDRRLIWNWAADQAFTLALWKMTLQPGESKKYEITWDGKNNEGNTVAGDFLVRAKLVSTPGGETDFANLQIRE